MSKEEFVETQEELKKRLDPYNIMSVHDQKGKKNCSSHSFAVMIEFNLSKRFGERTLVDVDDLWEKQKKFGTATDEHGDSMEDVIYIAENYGVRFKTDSGRVGTFFSGNKIEFDDGHPAVENPIIESLISQIKVLHAELEKLGMPIFPKKQSKWKKIKSFFKNFWVENLKNQKIAQCKKEQVSLLKRTEKIINTGKANKIEIGLNFPSIEISDIEKQVAALNEIEVNIKDDFRRKEGFVKINQKYEIAGGTGAIIPEGFIDFAVYAFYWLFFPWFIKHVLEDIDSLAWEKFKSIFLKIYKIFSGKNGKKDMVIVASYRPLDGKIPTITFSVQPGISDQEFGSALDKIPELLKSSMDIYRKDKKFIFEFKYDVKNKDWYL